MVGPPKFEDSKFETTHWFGWDEHPKGNAAYMRVTNENERRTFVVKVQILYFDGCPNWTIAEERLRDALELSGESSAIERCIIDNQEAAERLEFAGSPSILLNGRDPFRSAPGNFGLTCRVYMTSDGPSGSPALNQLISAIKEANHS
jgi:hypothetical protein